MKVDEKIKDRLQAVVALGQQVLRTEHTSPNGGTLVDEGLAAQWVASARNLFASAFGNGSQFFELFAKYTSHHLWPDVVKLGHGVVLGAQADYLAGGIFSVRRLVEAEIFDDFLEQAAALLAAGYRGPAAVVAGCVLEDALRKLCDRHGVAMQAKHKFEDLNQALRAKQAYDQATWRMLQAQYDLRNLAAHHPEKWTELTEQKVDGMIDFARKFLFEHSA